MTGAAERLAELAGRSELSALERGELRALRRHVVPAQTGAASARDRAVALLSQGDLTPGQRGELRAVASGLPAEVRRQVESYLNTKWDGQ